MLQERLSMYFREGFVIEQGYNPVLANIQIVVKKGETDGLIHQANIAIDVEGFIVREQDYLDRINMAVNAIYEMIKKRANTNIATCNHDFLEVISMDGARKVCQHCTIKMPFEKRQRVELKLN